MFTEMALKLKLKIEYKDTPLWQSTLKIYNIA